MSTTIKLGESAEYASEYSPDFLEPIPRAASRESLVSDFLDCMCGSDIWHAYELSWLSSSGKPQVAMATFSFDCKSEFIIESKSFKYYLNSFNQSKFVDWDSVQSILKRDLGLASNGHVSVVLSSVGKVGTLDPLPGDCVDSIDVEDFVYQPTPRVLTVGSELVREKCLYSHLLKSNCPVTGQPDWASLWIKYSGKIISPENFLRYVISFRQHQDFHENCVEKIYGDLMQYCKPEYLSVYACYTRRGGLDINPFRSNVPCDPPRVRLNRQ